MSLFGGFFVGFMALVILIAVFGGGVYLSTTSDCDSDDNSATTTAASKIGKITVKDSSNYLTKIKNISKAVGKKIGVQPRMLFSQLYAESGPDGSQPVNTQDHNYGGMTWTAGCGYSKGTTRGNGGSEGGWYRHYKNVSEFASDWAVTVKSNFSELGNPKSLSDYLAKMKAKGYMADNNMAGYLSRMKTGWAKWPGKSTLSGAAQAADDAATDTGEDCDTDGGDVSGNAIVREARKWLGKFHYSQGTHTANDNWRHPSSDDTTDCSGFVYLVLKRVGCKLPPDRWWTGPMEDDARGAHKYLKQIKPSQAGAGDIIIANSGSGSGDSGHTAILLGKYKGGSTKIIEMGGDSKADGVNIRTISYAFGWLFTTGRVTLARPVSVGKAKKSSGSSSSSKVVKNLSKTENAARLAIIAPESHGNYKAINGKYYGAYQLDKSYITSKMYGGDGSLSKANQDYVAYKYMKSRYGSWQNALKFRKIKNWW